ncbi:hypothetical protein NHX12_030639 [Muraenolepis orangiensis]|uniref:Msx2-interacting protein n=1 Tax=Muraenolepis orangiensis TaxID=630683 RepID=A0A9Q0EA88_9TELE|nr:hypothetical protein NHX12_030639 [Muraenolepis orangiensis]
MVRETRHLWVGNLPEHVREEKIVEHFKRYGRVESVKVLRKRGSEGGVAAFVDFVDIKSAQKAHNAVNKMGDRDLRTDYNEPGSVPSAVRGLEDNTPSSSRDVTGFSRGTVGPVFGPPLTLHTREGRYERRIDGSSETRERAYDHSPYGHHERSGTFDRQRHYNPDYYRDRSMFAATGPGSSAMGPGFEASDPHFESRIRDPFTLTSTARRDLYRDDRGRRVDRTYHHRRSRSSHSSQSRHPSPQRSTGQTPKVPHSPKRAPLSPGRGPHSRSRSRSSSSDSVSSTSSTGSGSDSNSSSSDGSRARSVQSSAAHAPPQPSMGLDSEEPRRSFGIKVQNLPVRSTDTSLKDGLFHEFKKHGKVTSVQIHGATEDRYGLVFFRQQEDQEKALTVSKGKLFFGMLIEVIAWNGPETESENEFRPLDGRIDEFHPKATRTLFIGNLEKTTSYQQLLDIFQRFGEIVDIDIKKVNGVPQYAFVQYSDIASVCKAIKKMDGEYLGSNRLKLGFGKSMPTTCVWLDGLASNITEQYLTRHFCRYGHVVKVLFDRLKGMALILYNNTDFAQAAVRETKGWKIGGSKIKVDFASQESQMAFYRSMQSSGQDIRDFYEIPPERREERRPPYHEFTAERAYYESVRTPGIYPEDARRDYPARSRERFPDLEHFQGEPFDPRFHEDPREYRDFRDPFEQDIRKYTYIQRERERERERFEADRGRWSPSHPRRPITPTVSPSPSERAHRDSERRVYSQSSERSGSASSLSPPHFEKSDKNPLEPGSKGDKTDKNVQADRVASAETGSSSPKGIPVMLPSGIAPMQQYVHHQEQSVIMPPHSGLGRMSPHPSHVSQAIPMGHLVQDTRVNTPPLSVMNSPWSGSLQQRPTSPQAVSRDMVLKVNPGSVRGHEGEPEEARRFHQVAVRQSVTQLKAESLQAGSLRGGLQLDTYMTQRDMRVLIHQQGERTAPDQHGGHIQDTLPPSSTSSNIPISLSPRAHMLKGVSEKDVAKSLEAKRPHSPHSKDSIMGIRPPGSAIASPQRVQLIPPTSSGSFPEYSGLYANPRSIHQQMPETSPAALNQSPVTITPAMGTDPQAKTDGKMTQPVNMVQLLTKYPIVWQGLLALKNDTAAVQLHFVCGNKALAHRSLPLQEGGALLRIVQRMRLEASQLESVARRMTGETDFCLLLALPCGRDQEDVLNQTQALKAAFINYLQAKLAAGIINIPNPGSNQPAYVLQIFPPCEFSESHLSQLAPDLLNRISSISPHLMIVITSV